jgi:hypothetical protein
MHPCKHWNSAHLHQNMPALVCLDSMIGVNQAVAIMPDARITIGLEMPLQHLPIVIKFLRK